MCVCVCVCVCVEEENTWCSSTPRLILPQFSLCVSQFQYVSSAWHMVVVLVVEGGGGVESWRQMRDTKGLREDEKGCGGT